MAELLAPAGNMACLRAAVQGGADAVYLAGKAFGARAAAGNFDYTELTEAVRYAHVHSVRVYVTVNILINDSEFRALETHIKQLCSCGIDAVIVQDIGAAKVIHQIAPDLPLHASTQMTVQNEFALAQVAAYGICRVVLPRELTTQEIKKMADCAATYGISIEVFAHGALCYCVSGQCLMSSLLGGRSGNRGRCAQPCRMPYSLTNAAGKVVAENCRYPLSPKDLCTLEELPLLLAAGVSSLKIEGRLKPPEYVFTVTKAYRAALTVCAQGLQPMADTTVYKAFNRGFTTAHLNNNISAQAMSWDKPNNHGEYAGLVVETDGNQAIIAAAIALNNGDTMVADIEGAEVMASVAGKAGNGRYRLRCARPLRAGASVWRVIDGQYSKDIVTEMRRNLRTVEVAARCKLSGIGQVLQLELADYSGNNITVSGTYPAEAAQKNAIDCERITKQLRKTGDGPFVVTGVDCEIADGLSLPVSEINEVRRRGLALLEDKRATQFAGFMVRPAPLLPDKCQARPAEPLLLVAVDTRYLAEVAAQNGAAALILMLECCGNRADEKLTAGNISAIATAYGAKIPVYIELPRIILPHNTNTVRALLRKIRTLDIAGYYGGIGLKKMLESENISAPCYAAAELPLFNSWSLARLAEDGWSGGMLSPELSSGQISDMVLPEKFSAECYVYGRLELMVSTLCLPGMALGGKNGPDCVKPCQTTGELFLTDRKGERFPLRTDQFCRMHLFNCRTHDLSDSVKALAESGIRRFRLDARLLDAAGVVTALTALRNGMQGISSSGSGTGKTRGHYYRGVE